MGKVYDALKKRQTEDAAPRLSPSVRPPEETRPSPPPPPPPEPGRVEAAEAPPRPAASVLDGIDPHLIIHPGADSILIEQYKILRTRLFQGRAEPPKSILITSIAPREGKSTLAANLAISTAQGSPNDVLLVDADLRAPAQNSLFGLPARPGIEAFLNADCPLEQALQKSSVEHLHLLPCGKAVPRISAELLTSGRMKELVAELKSRYGLIIFDSTPLSVTADAAIIADDVDAVLLVVRAGMVNRDMISQCLNRIDKKKIIGSVLTCAPFKPFDQRYKYHYKYYSH